MEKEELKIISMEKLSDYFIQVYKGGADVLIENDEEIYIKIPRKNQHFSKAKCVFSKTEQVIKMNTETFKKYAPFLYDFEVDLSLLDFAFSYLYIDTKGRFVVNGSKAKKYPIIVFDNKNDIRKEDDIHIYIGIIQNNDTVSKISCYFNEKDKELKIPFQTFKKYAYCLKGFKINLNSMNNETRSVSMDNKYKVNITGKNRPLDEQQKNSKSVNIINNASTKYVRIESEDIIHDVTCERVNSNKHHLIDCSEISLANCCFCSECKNKILLRAHIENGNQNFLSYYKFFKDAMNHKKWKNIFRIQQDIHLLDVGENYVVLKEKEDVWEIRYSNEIYHLYHNNYIVTEDLKRDMQDGFHYQNKDAKSLVKILLYIHNYEWNKNHISTILENNTLNNIDVVEKKSNDEKPSNATLKEFWIAVIRKLKSFFTY